MASMTAILKPRYCPVKAEIFPRHRWAKIYAPLSRPGMLTCVSGNPLFLLLIK